MQYGMMMSAKPKLLQCTRSKEKRKKSSSIREFCDEAGSQYQRVVFCLPERKYQPPNGFRFSGGRADVYTV
jgi:hypothetical protein